MPLRARLLLCVLLACSFASACSTEPPAPDADYDPFSGLTGKADGISFDEVEWSLTYDSQRQRLIIEGEGESARYDDVEVEDHPGAYRRYRLDRGDRFATMRSLLLVEREWTELRAEYRLAEAMGLPAPRVGSAEHAEDGATMVRYALVEHVGDRFLQRHFDDDGRVLRDESERERLREALGRQGVSMLRGFDETFDAGTLGAANAFLEVSGGPVAFAELDEESVVAFVEVGASTTGGLRNALYSARVRNAYDDALDAAILCFDDEDCHLDVARGAAALDEQSRRNGGDAPTGDDSYRRHRIVDGDTIEVRFRHRTPEHYAAAVDLELDGSVVPLRYDDDEDLWVGSVSAPDLRTDYLVRSYFADGSDASEARVLNPDLDELLEVDRAEIDVAEPSGLALWGDQLLVVGDESNDVYFLDLQGSRVDQVEVGVRGMEGVAVDLLRQELLVTDEDRGDIVRLSFDGEELDRTHFAWADEASGIEGLSVDARTGHVLFAKENNPSSIAAMDTEGDELFRERVNFAADLSALAIDASEGLVYVLSDQDRTLYRLDDELRVEASWELDIRKPEGLVVNAGRVYITSDLDDELTIFDLVR
ncbi:MAG: SdiA-regulated domain-containing protein [Polyangiales bacterium]